MDIAATVLSSAAVAPLGEIDAFDLLALSDGSAGWPGRDYLTCRTETTFGIRTVKPIYSLTSISSARGCLTCRLIRGVRRIWAKPIKVESTVERSAFSLTPGGDLVEYPDERMTDALGRPGFLGFTR